MNIEVGKTYEISNENPYFEKGLVFKVIDIVMNDQLSEAIAVIDYENGGMSNRYLKTFKDVELKEIMPSSKPAHYDTAIDTIAFAKANFSREQVQGFMRINAIKYLQRDKGQTLSDLRKSAHYIQMLIEMEEEQG